MFEAAALAPLFAEKDAYLSAFRECRHEIESEWLDDVACALGQELERIVENPSDELVDAALHATARCLAQRGMPLASLLAAVACAGQAAMAVLGDTARPETLRALSELQGARARAYMRVYGPQPHAARRCTLPSLVTMAPQAGDGSYGIVGTSAAIARVRRAAEAAARGPSTILIVGESGSGKELVARAVHAASGSGQFVAVNCAALPNHLVESELFGHVRGAFTGAAASHAGLFRAAHKGTLFLDEVTEMGMETQAKLLRVLEERLVRPVGSLTETPVEVRVIASTNRNPHDAIAQHRLRADLFYRLQSFCIAVPPLRERREDVPLLVEHFLTSFCNRRCGCIWAVSHAAMRKLAAADWPGNVRELRNAIEHAITTGSNGVISVADLPVELRDTDSLAETPVPTTPLPTLSEAEDRLIRATLDVCGGNKLRAAESLGISRHKLYDRLKRLGLG